MNEELQSPNEQLETSNEELQSRNEELTTLNRQLQEKVRELEKTNDDLSNLLISTDIATLFLDSRLLVRRYTPAATRLLGAHRRLKLLVGDHARVEQLLSEPTGTLQRHYRKLRTASSTLS